MEFSFIVFSLSFAVSEGGVLLPLETGFQYGYLSKKRKISWYTLPLRAIKIIVQVREKSNT